MSVYLQLFLEFFQIGLFAIGGGPATIPFLMDLADRHPWYTRQDVANMLAVSESTPGPIGLNMSTYAGYNAAGFSGGITATLSLVLPSLIVIVLIAKLLDNFNENPYVKSAFWSIRPAVTGLIAAAIVGLFEAALFIGENGEWQFPLLSLVLCGIFFACMNIRRLGKLHPFFWIVMGAACGIVFQM